MRLKKLRSLLYGKMYPIRMKANCKLRMNNSFTIVKADHLPQMIILIGEFYKNNKRHKKKIIIFTTASRFFD